MPRQRYKTKVDCSECPEEFPVYFADPSEPFEGTCPACGTNYPELYV